MTAPSPRSGQEPSTPIPQSPKLLDLLRLELQHTDVPAEEHTRYAHWVVRYVRYHQLRHPRDLGREEVTAFLASLLTETTSVADRNQAQKALLFLYDRVLRLPLPAAPAAGEPVPEPAGAVECAVG